MDENTNKLLEEIKKLLIFQISQSGATNQNIGEVLGVSYKTVERMLPKQKKNQAKK